MSTIKEIEYAPISSIIELNSKTYNIYDFITCSLSGIVRVWEEKVKLEIL